jgi:Tfp pilus assembly protein PilX
MSHTRSLSKQKGMAMFISLVLLLLMSVIILHGARTSTLELLLGNNTQHTAQALMRAEDSAVAGESLIELNYVGAPTVDFSADGNDGLYIVGEIDVNTVDWSDYPAARIGAGDDFREYIIEYLGPATATGGSLSVGAGVASDTRYLYRVSGRGASSRGGARVVQTIFATVE